LKKTSHTPTSPKPRGSAPSNGRVIVSHDPLLSREAALDGIGNCLVTSPNHSPSHRASQQRVEAYSCHTEKSNVPARNSNYTGLEMTRKLLTKRRQRPCLRTAAAPPRAFGRISPTVQPQDGVIFLLASLTRSP
jgi:hypothetical protein